MFNKELDRNKKRVFQVVLIFTILGGFGFAVLNYFRDQFTLAITELCAATLSFIFLLYVNKITSIAVFKKTVFIHVMFFFSLMMFIISSDGVSITVLAWVLVIPLLSYLLLGLKLGFYITALFYCFSAVIVFNKFNVYQVMTEPVAYANLILCALVFWGVSHGYEHANQEAKYKLKQAAILDPLTKLYNRTALQPMFDSTIDKAVHKQEAISLVLFDLDNFKSINDEFGHEAGDQVLIQFAKIVQSAIKDKGYAFRIGGEEFAAIFSAQSDLMVLSLAENIRRDTEKIIIPDNLSEKTFSVSAGVVTQQPQEATLNELMITADRRMYHGKNQGRNVVIHKG